MKTHAGDSSARAPARDRVIFQLEEGEILAEPMPTRLDRKGFLFYEATEGALACSRASWSPSQRSSPRSRCEALRVMHFESTGRGLPVGP